MNRREFLGAVGLARLNASRYVFLPGRASEHSHSPDSASLSGERSQSLATEGWRLFEVTTHVHVQNASGPARAWLPTPLVGTPYQQTLGDTYQAEGGRVVMVESEELDLLYAEWPAGVDPILTLTSRVAIRDQSVDLTTPRVAPPPDFSTFARYLRPIKGIVVEPAAPHGASTDLERARALFDAHAASPPATGGDRHSAYVAHARAGGIPARPVYGLGLGAADATRAQQSRAEVYLTGFGWVPVDVTQRTFGAWTGAWTVFNTAHDVSLPKSAGRALPYFMHPQAESDNGRADNLAADTFRYDIAVRPTG